MEKILKFSGYTLMMGKQFFLFLVFHTDSAQHLTCTTDVSSASSVASTLQMVQKHFDQVCMKYKIGKLPK